MLQMFLIIVVARFSLFFLQKQKVVNYLLYPKLFKSHLNLICFRIRLVTTKVISFSDGL